MTETATKSRTKIEASNAWRWIEGQAAYDSYGLPTDTMSLGGFLTLGVVDQLSV